MAARDSLRNPIGCTVRHDRQRNDLPIAWHHDSSVARRVALSGRCGATDRIGGDLTPRFLAIRGDRRRRAARNPAHRHRRRSSRLRALDVPAVAERARERMECRRRSKTHPLLGCEPGVVTDGLRSRAVRDVSSRALHCRSVRGDPRYGRQPVLRRVGVIERGTTRILILVPRRVHTVLDAASLSRDPPGPRRGHDDSPHAAACAGRRRSDAGSRQQLRTE